MTPATLIGRGVRTIESTKTGIRIPVISAKGLVFSAWQPSPEELQDLLRGSYVWLVQRGPLIPEMTMQVGQEQDVIPSDVRLRAIQAEADDPYERAVAAKQHEDKQNRLVGRIMLGTFVLAVVVVGVLLWAR